MAYENADVAGGNLVRATVCGGVAREAPLRVAGARASPIGVRRLDDLPHVANTDSTLGTTMQFLRTLRDRIRSGELTTTVRLWQRPHVKVGGRYALPPGEIVVTKVFEVGLADITPELARRSGFVGVVDLLRIAKHGPGRRVFVIEFRYEKPRKARRSPGPNEAS
ncbi:MAG TPA: hypothetical protein VH539_00785 [Gemmatimonadaceae bacterium]